MPRARQRSEILLRRWEGTHAKWAGVPVKIGLALNLNCKTVLTLSLRQFRRALSGFDSSVELACFRVSRGKRSDEERIVLLRAAIQASRQFNSPCSVS